VLHDGRTVGKTRREWIDKTIPPYYHSLHGGRQRMRGYDEN